MKAYRKHFVGICLLLAAAFSQTLYAQYPILTRVQDGKTLQYFGDKIAVKFKEGITQESMEKLAADFSATIARHHFAQWYTLDLPKNTDPFDLIPLISQRNEVAYVELDRLISAADDFSNQWGLNNTGQTINPPGGPIIGTSDADIDAPEAWSITQGASTIKIGIVDTGIDNLHPEFTVGGLLAGNFLVLPGSDIRDNDNFPWDTPLEGHGTRMTGNMAAIHGNNVGIRGVSPNCTFIPIRINITSTTSAAAGVRFAADNGAKVINASWGDPNGDFSQMIADAIDVALSYDALVVAVGGNDAGPIWFPGNWSDERSNILTVTASDQNDLKAMPTASGPEISIAAPGRYTYTTFVGQTWSWENGASTSQATAYTSGIAGLVRSINPSLSASQVRDVIQQSALEVGPYDYYWDEARPGHSQEMGYGRASAYQAILLAYAYSNKSVSVTATANNNGRRVVKSATDGKWHVVYESGITSGGAVLGEVYYRNTSNGVSWSTPRRVSDGLEKSRYPTIAERGGNLYVVWQRKNGSTHDIYYDDYFYSLGIWGGALALATNVGSADPLPVIASPNDGELMVVFRSGNNLGWRRLANSSWSTVAYITGTALNSPSLCAAKAPWSATVASLAYATNAIPNASNIIARYFNSPNWSQEHNMSSGLPGNLSQHARPSIAPGGDATTNLVHIAWDAYDSQYSARVIIHKAMSTWNVPSSYYEFHNIDEDQPSITGLAGSKAAMVFRRGTGNFFIGSYNGSSWSIQFPAVAGKYPSFSLGGTQAKHLITSGSAAPYQVTLSSSTYSKANLLTAADKSGGYHRAVGLVDTTTGAWLNARVENFLIKHKDGSYSFVDFTPAPSDTLVLSTEDAWAALASGDFLLPVDAESLLVEVSVAGEKAANLSNSPNPFTLEFKAETANGQPRTKTFSPLAFVSNEAFNQTRLSLAADLNGLNTKDSLAFKATIVNLANSKSIVASLGHIYELDDSTGSARPKRLREHTPEVPKHFVLEQNYPNPFNPETTILYALPYAAHVQLVILNTLGQEVARLVEGEKAAGHHRVTWKTAAHASGIYFYRLKAGDFEQMKKMSLVR